MTKSRWTAALAALCAVAGLVLAACGPATNSADYKSAFEKGFTDSFDRTTHDGCVKSASGGAAADVAERYCSCVVAELDKLSVDQRMKLNPSSPELPAAAATCKAKLQS